MSKDGYAVLVQPVFTPQLVTLRARWHDPRPRTQVVATIPGPVRYASNVFYSDNTDGELVVSIHAAVAGDNDHFGYLLAFHPKRGFRVKKRHAWKGNNRGPADEWMFQGTQRTDFMGSAFRKRLVADGYLDFGQVKLTTTASDGTASTIEVPGLELRTAWRDHGNPTMPYDWDCDATKCCEAKKPHAFAAFWHIERVCFSGRAVTELHVMEPVASK